MIDCLYPCFRHWSEKGSVWVFSDPHFEDEDCKLMDKRWISSDEQAEILRRNCHKNDTLIILGDIGNPEYLKRVKARKVLVKGNHDSGSANYREYFDEIYDGALFISDKILLSHEPIRGLPFCINIHGHDHSGWEKSEADIHINVAANVVSYIPVNLGALIKAGVLHDVPSIHRICIDKASKNKIEKEKASYGIFHKTGKE